MKREGSSVPLIVDQLSAELKQRLPESYELLRRSNLTVHPAVYQVVLSGSRGPKGGFRPGSDIDLSLLVAVDPGLERTRQAEIFAEVLETTWDAWHGAVELDTVAVFDKKGCGLHCFQEPVYREGICAAMADDCLGLYKLQKGFSGFVPPIGIRIGKVFPLITVWEREISAS
jgi:predicted nucleotidyltransferase